MASVAVTGAAGFLGRHLVRELERRGHQAYGLDLSVPGGVEAERWRAVGRGDQLGAGIATLIADRTIDLVIHAAFLNRKPADMSHAAYLHQANASDLSVFETCAAAGVRVVLVSSSAVYGARQTPGGLREDDPVAPVTIYGVAKATQEMLAGFHALSSGLRLVVARLFNLCGPGQSEGMLIPDWVARVSAIVRGGPARLVVRNRATTRDFVDVRDASRALAFLAEAFAPGELVNVASGTPVSLRELGDELQRLGGVPYDVIETDPVPSGTDPVMHFGSPARMRERYGWTPQIPWQTSLADAWREHQARS